MTAGGGLRVAVVIVLTVLVSACWIPLPEETAIVVEVLGPQGEPVDGVRFNLDGTETLTTGDQLNPGQIFKSLDNSGLHTLQLEVGTLLDPQGGAGWVPLASQMSG